MVLLLALIGLLVTIPGSVDETKIGATSSGGGDVVAVDDEATAASVTAGVTAFSFPFRSSSRACASKVAASGFAAGGMTVSAMVCIVF